MQVAYDLERDLPVKVSEWTPSSSLETFHWHTALEIGYCVSGSGWFFFGDKKYRAKAGDVFVVNNMERHIAQSDPDNPSKYLFVFFSKEIVESEQELLLPFIYRPATFQNQIPAEQTAARKIGQLIHFLRQEFAERQPAFQAMIRGTMMQICALLLRHYGQHSPPGRNNSVFSLYFILLPALSYLQENFREPLELSDVASQLALSPSRTRHLFKEVMGIGFKDYLTELRVNEAKKLLASTDLSIMQVYLQSGFQNHNSFYRAFNAIVGMTPNQYRFCKSK
ncbi:AraC family transcriptional regulator [Paenibacillus xerothermodurans]|uniref:AraC family transcriptional regulator n=1 Tax=Paenibacillus xerothermodurans TaxID=1977292 RepID=A0A2W1NNN9_PAEXE|nr:AraC family transcriptional regulator [Paenibacillus xerothermodurans]PZE20543.1 AraC family transcriptional regulator [Paenibacillus xerothermodurans]